MADPPISPRAALVLSSHDLIVEAGRKVLYFHFRKMLRHEIGTILGDDIEELHDMRVAIRRMRSALQLFGPYFDNKSIKLFVKGLRKTGKALGRVRDLDVFLENLQNDHKSLAPLGRTNLEILRAAWLLKQTAARSKMRAYLECCKYLKYKLKFWDFLETPGAGVNLDTSLLQVKNIAPRLITSSLQIVYAHHAKLTEPTVPELHALRIAFKRHRYTLEFFRSALGPEVEDCIFLMKKIQDHLGDLNDAEFAANQVENYIGGLLPAAESSKYLLALNDFVAIKRSEVEKYVVDFPFKWDQFSASEYEENLIAAQAVLFVN
jgi:CHAD domain-containing protein